MNQSEPEAQAGWGQEALALFLLFAALFLLAGLISYCLPLLAPEPAFQLPEANWCGKPGFYTAHYLLSFLGLMAVVPICILLWASTRVFVSLASPPHLPAIVAGVTGAAISSSGLFGGVDQLLLPASHVAPGGYLGTLIRGLLDGVIGEGGATLTLVLLLLFSLMAAVRFSPLGLLVRLLPKGGRVRTSSRQQGDGLAMAPANKRRKTGASIPSVSVPQSETAAVTLIQPEVHEPVAKNIPFRRRESQISAKTTKAGKFKLPPITLLNENTDGEVELGKEHYYEVSAILLAKLQDFGVQGEIAGISPGPVVTTYEFAPAPGVKINKIVTLADDLAMVLKVDRVRIVGSIPGKAAIGIEIPNPVRQTVYLRDIISTTAYQNASSMLTLALGFDVIGRPVVANLARMPHLLIAGATGAGKSVAINAFIASILFKAGPEEVRLLMIDPKRIELSVYDDIPHLLHPVVVEAKMASRALLWAVREMERRYRLLEEKRVKSFASYNEVAEDKLPYIVIIVDELADLMMVASKDVETSIARLAQMARAAGMHIILATQRPSVDVLTGLIKANFPTRISFKVSSKVDSRTILDGSGAEHLLGMGDMLFLPPGAAKLQRIHGAYISEQETDRLVEYLKHQGTAVYDDSVLQEVEEEPEAAEAAGEEYDEKYDEAVALVTSTGQASISMVQRRLRIGYNRAARMIEIMEKEGIVGPSDGSRPREVLVRAGYQE